MAYEKDYEALLMSLKKIDASSRHLMKGMHRREMENAHLREVIANLLQNSKTLSERERDMLMRALQYDPGRKVRVDFEDWRAAIRLKIGSKTLVGEQ